MVANEFSSDQLTELRHFSDSVKISRQPEPLLVVLFLFLKNTGVCHFLRDAIGDLCSAIAVGARMPLKL